MGQPNRLAIIIANGTLPHPDRTRGRVRAWLADAPDALVIAADGGARNALTLDLTPHTIIGDLDSLDDMAHEHLKAAGVTFVSASVRKDETDLELALRHAVKHGAGRIRMLGALGGRLDQTLANILLLALPLLDGVDVRIVEGAQTAWLVKGETEIEGEAGDTLSLIPLGGEAKGVTTEGLEYPLEDATLLFGPTQGVSNVLTGPLARVNVREGLLLVVHTAGGTS